MSSLEGGNPRERTKKAKGVNLRNGVVSRSGRGKRRAKKFTDGLKRGKIGLRSCRKKKDVLRDANRMNGERERETERERKREGGERRGKPK